VSNNVEAVAESLFSVGGTTKHSTDKHDLKAGDRVEFRGSGAILSVVFEGPVTDEWVEASRLGYLAGGFELLEYDVEHEAERPLIPDVTTRWKARSWLRDKRDLLRKQDHELTEQLLFSRP
jgi:hypothetical protein